MPQERLSNDEASAFFAKLSDLLASKKDHGSVFLTQKRLSPYDPSNAPPTKTLTRPAKVTKPSASAKKRPAAAASTTFTRTAYPAATEENLRADLLALLSPVPSTAGTATESVPETEYSPPVLIRATNGKSNDPRHDGKHIKMSTVVEADQLEAFFTRYAEVWKQGLVALKKKVRKGKKSKKSKKK
ncbi:hypothetical protein DRE_06067 [Drechslerella stenobrocha 248]|uniref:Signal recognition particle subunit SRP14 n=1 Tax=Drechslerella stenobrocha 248 TaxID=1043628 RepID=W7HPW0_9PEZI|nr:hypothetical protein DRE_06067 [Drechslerella stenobrocha 248]